MKKPRKKHHVTVRTTSMHRSRTKDHKFNVKQK